MSDGLDQPRLGLTPEPDEERREDVLPERVELHQEGREDVLPERVELEEDEAAEAEAEAQPEPEEEQELPAEEDELPRSAVAQHAAGELRIPDGYGVIEGEPTGNRRAVGVVVARFNGELTSELLTRALDELERAGVGREAVTVIPVPGAFELPLAAMALAKTRRYSCIVALGAVIRGETPHFEYVASEAASGLQLAGLETGVPVAFGVLTTESEEQARARLDKGAEAVRTALEMADVFSQLRAAASTQPACGLQLHSAADVQGLRDLREETVLRPQPEPFDGGDEAALQPEPPARARPARRQGDARERVHALPQGQQGPKGRLATSIRRASV
jgi:6,7-dimethyl-8-ribityllumazine synthase